MMLLLLLLLMLMLWSEGRNDGIVLLRWLFEFAV